MQLGTRRSKSRLAFIVLTAFLSGASTLLAQTAQTPPDVPRPWMNPKLSPEERAELVLQQMTLDEKLALLHGNGMAHEKSWNTPLTQLANGGAGYVEGVPRLGIPPLIMSDAAYGVRDSAANGRYSTAMPSNLGAASSWDTDSACAYGEIIGEELRAQGFTMTLGGGVDLVREPRNGRTFEYTGEDPLLAGTMDGSMMKCEQGQHIVGDIKHYVMNDQETGRNFVSAVISKKAMQESDLLAFHIAISIANPAAIMCAYNRVNGDYACENPYTLHDVLKGSWGFKGFVLSDWGGTHSTVAASAAGLDQEQPMDKFFGPKLKEAVEAGQVPMSQIDDHARRVLYGEFLSGIVDDPPQKSVVDVQKGFDVARRVEEESIVLLKNAHSILPINASRVHSIAIIGGHADVGMISGGGSAQVDPPGGNAIAPRQGRVQWHEHVWFPTSPMKALEAELPNTKIMFDPGTDLDSAAALAKSSDLTIVFADQWESEGMDLKSLALSDEQNALIEKVAAANPRTVVVFESGTAVTMPWIDKVAGVVEAWYAGSSGHKALANVLTGAVNPSGKLPITFPKDENDLPHPVIPPAPDWDPAHTKGRAVSLPTNYAVNYNEGAEVGYKWFEAEHKQPLFAFGFGLSYTSYRYSGLSIDAVAKTVSFTVTNTGNRAGAEIAEVYAKLPQTSDESAYKRLAGWKRIALAPGESQKVTVPIDARVLETFDETTNNWSLASGEYAVFVGGSSDKTPLMGSLAIR